MKKPWLIPIALVCVIPVTYIVISYTPIVAVINLVKATVLEKPVSVEYLEAGNALFMTKSLSVTNKSRKPITVSKIMINDEFSPDNSNRLPATLTVGEAVGFWISKYNKAVVRATVTVDGEDYEFTF